MLALKYRFDYSIEYKRGKYAMIYTITFNPSLDYIVEVDNFQLGSVNRTTKENLLCGGKGINVSIVLRNLDVDSKALGFVAGFTGKEIINRVNDFGVKNDFIEVQDGYSRINFKMKSNEESEVNGNGPTILTEDVAKLMKQLEVLQKGDMLVLSGSIPSSLPNNIYQQIMLELEDQGIDFVVDATGDLLMKSLEYNPFLIKPNNHELAEMFHVKLNTKEDIICYAKKLQQLGARNVLISMAGDGAILVDENRKVYYTSAPKGKVVNSVGAGDSMVAGFVAGYNKNRDYLDAFKMGVATGSASAFSKDLATKKEVEKILSTLTEVNYEN